MWREEQIGSARLICADCREVLPTLVGVDVILTDQPYGSGWVTGGKSVGKFSANGSSPQWDVWSTDWISLINAKTYAAFCPCSRISDLVQAFGGGQLRFYVKSNPRPPLRGADAPSVEPIVIFPRVRFGSGPQHFVSYNGDNEFHPTQKPLAVMDWLVSGVSAPDELVCDPFTGSGSTGVSCVRLGRRFIGIEKDPAYFEIALRRIEQAQRQKDLFVDAPVPQPPEDARVDLFAEPAQELTP